MKTDRHVILLVPCHSTRDQRREAANKKQYNNVVCQALWHGWVTGAGFGRSALPHILLQRVCVLLSTSPRAVLVYFYIFKHILSKEIHEMNASYILRFPIRCAFLNSYLAAHQSCVLAVIGLRMFCSSQSAKPQRLRRNLSIWQRSPSLATTVTTVSQQSPRETTHFSREVGENSEPTLVVQLSTGDLYITQHQQPPKTTSLFHPRSLSLIDNHPLSFRGTLVFV
jgi:hypothetical protein